MSAKIAVRVETYLRTLFGRKKKRRSAEFEAFRFSFFEDPNSARDGLDTNALMRLEGRERDIAEHMLIHALPDARAILGLGAMRSCLALRRLESIFEFECATAQAARFDGNSDWRSHVLIFTARALWRIDPRPRYARAVIGTLRCAPTWTERMDAAAALAEMTTTEVEQALTEALDDRHALVRHHAARSLLAIHGVEADARAMNHMIYRVMAEDIDRREGGRRDIIAAVEDSPRSPPRLNLVNAGAEIGSIRPRP